ncbi:MAG: hypothetical protein WA890_15290 [Micromonospora sp.]
MTALTVGMEVWAANDHNALTETWTEALTNFIPAPILLAVVAWFASWLVQHFRDSTRKKAAQVVDLEATQDVSSLSARRRYEHGQ